jgi:hypothetical protein
VSGTSSIELSNKLSNFSATGFDNGLGLTDTRSVVTCAQYPARAAEPISAESMKPR